MKIKNVLFYLCLIASCSGYAQSKFKVGLKMNLGPYGINNSDEEQDVDTYFNIGLTSHVFLTSEEKFSVGIDFLYNSSVFSYRSDIFNLMNTFSMKNVFIPLKANYHFNKWTLSAGLINSFVIDAKLKNDEYELQDGTLYTFNQEESRLAILNKRYDLLATLGARYKIGNRINLGLETTFYFANNDFYFRRYPNYSFNVRNLNYTSISWTAIYFLN
jgi:hypothetical protein